MVGKGRFMPDPDFVIKRNDTSSYIQSTLENSGGTAVSITGASILWKMCPIGGGGTLSIVGSGTIDQSSATTNVGQVHYSWPAASVATAGLYAGEWEVTFSSGSIQTFPNGDPILVAVNKDLPY
jgi:hypothetical protein